MITINNLRKSLSVKEVLISIIVLIFLNVLVLNFAEYRDNILFYKVLYTARLTLFLFNIAFCLYILPDFSPQRSKYWLIFWTGSFLSYAVHIYYSYFLFFHGNIIEFYKSQGIFVATLNLVITIWWLSDILITWAINSDMKWIPIQKTGIHILLFVSFFSSTVIFHAVDHKELFVIILGIILGVSVLISLYIRIKSNFKNKASS